MTRARARLWLFASSLLFGAMAAATKYVSAELTAAQIALFRFAVGLVGVGVLVALRPGTWRLSRPWMVMVRGTLGGLAVLLLFVGIEHLGAGLGILVGYTSPLWATLFGALVLREALTWRALAAFAVTSAGLVAILGPGELMARLESTGATSLWLGVLAALGSGVLSGAAIVSVRALRRTDSAATILGGFCLAGVVLCTPVALADWRPISDGAWLWLLLVGVLAFVAQLLFTQAMAYIEAGAGAMTNQLTVVAAYAFGVFFLGEALSAQTALGGALVLAGLTLVR